MVPKRFSVYLTGSVKPGLLILLCLSFFDNYAQQVRFTASAENNKVSVNTAFIIEYKLENSEGKDFKLPDVTPFKIVGGPATSTSLSIINGVRSSFTSYQYSLLATKTGKFTLSPATVRVGGKKIESNALNIEVVENTRSKNFDQLGDKSLSMVRMETSTTVLYRGQQVVLDYVLYTRQNVESFNLLNEPVFDGFYANPVSDLRIQPQRQTIGGNEYLSQVIRRIILYPQKTGNFNVEPAVFELAIPVDGPSGGFFFRRDIMREQFTTNALKFEVRELPSGAPPSFTGGVGEYTMQAVLNKKTCKVNDAVVVRMEIEGNGDPKVLSAPDFDVPSFVEKYQPNIIQDETYYVNGMNVGKKIFEYVMVPEKDSAFTISPAFSFFSPGSGKYETITTGPFQINVLRQDLTGGNSEDVSPGPDISGIERSTNLFPSDKRYFGSVLHLTSLFLIFIAAIAMLLKYKRQQILENLNPSEKKRMLAKKVALSKLTNALEAKNTGDKRLFFDEISKALTGYLKDKYALSNAQLNMQELTKNLSERGVIQKDADTILGILNRCEMAVFAGLDVSMDNMFEEAAGVISRMEEA